MPELPEVETIKLGLERRIKGLKIKEIQVRQAGMFIGSQDDALDGRVLGIRRRAKILIIDLKKGVIPEKERSHGSPMSERVVSDSRMTGGGDYSLVIHLKMTGQLVFQSVDEKVKVVGGHPQAEYNRPLPHAHTHIIISFTDGSHLYFNDLRRFGWMKVMRTEEVEEMKFVRELGAEPLSEEFKNQRSKFKMTMQNSKRAIKTLLMDQSVISGIGNIYSDEILYQAGIRPDMPAASLTDDEIEKLFEMIPKVLQIALDHGGTSDSTYIGVDGERGDYLRVAAVYHKSQDPKGHQIVRKKIGGRTAHYCLICQK